MGKETKIGLAVVGSLLLLFGYVLYSRIAKEAAAVAKNGDKGKATTAKSAKAPLSSGPDQSASAANKPKSLSSGPSKPNMLKADVAASKPPANDGAKDDPYRRLNAPAPSSASSTDSEYSRPSFRGNDAPLAPLANIAGAAAATADDVPSYRSAKSAVGAAASDIYRSAGEAASSLVKEATANVPPGDAMPASDPFAQAKRETTETVDSLTQDAKQTAQQLIESAKSAVDEQPGRLDHLARDAAAELNAKARDATQSIVQTKEDLAAAASNAITATNATPANDNPLRPTPSFRDAASSPPPIEAQTTHSSRNPPSYDIYAPATATEPPATSTASAMNRNENTPSVDPFAKMPNAAANELGNAATYAAPPLAGSARSFEPSTSSDRQSTAEYSPSKSRFNSAEPYQRNLPETRTASAASDAPSSSSFRSRMSSPPPPAMPEVPARGTTPTYGSQPSDPGYQQPDRFARDTRGVVASTETSSSTFGAHATAPPPRSYSPAALPATGSTASGGFGGSRASTAPRRHVGERYVVEPNDNYWLISEKAYGNGAFFKALQEHNKDRYPLAESLQAGDELSTPPVETLQQNYPQLCPKPQRLELAQRPAGSFASQRPTGRTYVVEAGDTLFDIARFELGKAARWSEIYELNKDLLGQDFNHLTPGMKLALPNDGQGDSMTRRPGAFPR